jgi:hypothetical protein
MLLLQAIRDRTIGRRTHALYRAVHALPLDARHAMLAALEEEELIVGAYTDRRGRICPMLAAHRRGVRVCVGEFPRAWDDFGRANRPRPASPREIQILKALLEESVTEAPAVDRQPEPVLA